MFIIFSQLHFVLHTYTQTDSLSISLCTTHIHADRLSLSLSLCTTHIHADRLSLFHFVLHTYTQTDSLSISLSLSLYARAFHPSLLQTRGRDELSLPSSFSHSFRHFCRQQAACEKANVIE